MEKAFPGDGSSHNKKYIFAILAMSLLLYCSVFVGIPFFFSTFPENLQFSIITLVLIILLTFLTFTRHLVVGDSDLKGEILPASVISAYSIYLLWSALDSDVEEIDAKEVDKNHSVKLLVGVVFAVLSLMYSAYNTSNSLNNWFGDDDDEENNISRPLISASNEQPSFNYNTVPDADHDGEYELQESSGRRKLFIFHLLMLTASMYMAMLLTNWGVNEYNAESNHKIRKANVWVKLISQWITIGLYIWTLYAPAILSDRDFD